MVFGLNMEDLSPFSMFWDVGILCCKFRNKPRHEMGIIYEFMIVFRITPETF